MAYLANKNIACNSATVLFIQHIQVITMCVRYNIRYGRIDATDAETEEAAVLAGIQDRITVMPDGKKSSSFDI